MRKFSVVFGSMLTLVLVTGLFAVSLPISPSFAQEVEPTRRFSGIVQTAQPGDPIGVMPIELTATPSPLPTNTTSAVQPQPTSTSVPASTQTPPPIITVMPITSTPQSNPISVIGQPQPSAIPVTQIPLPPALRDLIELWLEYGSAYYDADSSMLYLDVPISESMMNTLIAEAIGLLGMDDAEVSVAFTPQHMDVTITNHETNTVFELNYVVSYNSTTILSLELVSASINGEPVPEEQLEWLDEAIKGTVETAIRLLLELLGLDEVPWEEYYSITNIVTYDDVMVLSVAINIPLDLPTGELSITLPELP